MCLLPRFALLSLTLHPHHIHTSATNIQLKRATDHNIPTDLVFLGLHAHRWGVLMTRMVEGAAAGAAAGGGSESESEEETVEEGRSVVAAAALPGLGPALGQGHEVRRKEEGRVG